MIEGVIGCFQLCPVNVKLFQGDKAFFFQAAHKLIVQFIQDFSCEFFPFKIVERIPLGFLPLGQPDKRKVSLA